MIETREFTVRMTESDDRTVTGVVVPWDNEIEVGGYRERFARGAIDPADTTEALLLYGHKEPIGKVLRGQDTDAGYVIEARISDTPKGNEVRTLLHDGVLTRMSIGFEPVTDDRTDDGVVVRTRVKFREASIVPFPAYNDAKILAVREEPTTTDMKDQPMTDITPVVDVEVRERLDDIDRRLSVIADHHAPTDTTPQYRSFGEFVQAVARGDEAAVRLVEESRAFAGGVAGATIAAPDPIVKNAWVSDVVRLVDFNRPSLTAFRQAPLPAEGMNVEWPQVKANSIAVAAQAAEADPLTFGKIELESKTSPVVTLGGYTAMSRQAIERSSYGYLDVAFRAMAIAYSKQTNAKVVADLAALAGTGTANAANTAAGILGALVDSALHIYTTAGLRPEFILCAGDVYKKIALLMDNTGRPITSQKNPQNNLGSNGVVTLTGEFKDLPIIVDPALATGACYIANSEAFVTYESGGAPWRLSDEDIVTLTKEFSIYGYLATAAPIPGAIVKVTVA